MTTPPPHSELITVHKVTIGLAIAGGLVFGAYSLWDWSSSGSPRSLVAALLSVAVSVALIFYLRAFARRTR